METKKDDVMDVTIEDFQIITLYMRLEQPGLSGQLQVEPMAMISRNAPIAEMIVNNALERIMSRS